RAADVSGSRVPPSQLAGRLARARGLGPSMAFCKSPLPPPGAFTETRRPLTRPLGEQFNYGGNTMTLQQTFRVWHDENRGRLVNWMTAVVRNRDIAEDITSTALGTAFKKLDTYRGESSLGTWIHALTLNAARQYLRENRHVSLESIDDPERT